MRGSPVQITFENLEEFKKQQTFGNSMPTYLPLGLFTAKAAVALCNAINIAISTVEYKTDFRENHRRWTCYNSYATKYLGMVEKTGYIYRSLSSGSYSKVGWLNPFGFRQLNPVVTIAPDGEVGLYFEKPYLSRIKRSANLDQDGRQSVTKERLGLLLKETWRLIQEDRAEKLISEDPSIEFEPIKFRTVMYRETNIDPKNPLKAFQWKSMDPCPPDCEDTIEVSYNEYRTLYQHLLGRDAEKTKKKYGEKAYEAIVGERNCDEFALATKKTIEDQIAMLVKECADKRQATESKWDQFMVEARHKRDDEIQAVVLEYDKKIKEMRESALQLINC